MMKDNKDISYTNSFSIIDYLTDELTFAVNRSRSQTLLHLKKRVSIDIENLLNAKKRCLSLPENLPALESTILNYGIDNDFMSIEADSPAYFDLLCHQIQSIINRFESRLSNVSVTYDKETNKYLETREINFKIKGTLTATHINELVVFDFILKSENEIAAQLSR